MSCGTKFASSLHRAGLSTPAASSTLPPQYPPSFPGTATPLSVAAGTTSKKASEPSRRPTLLESFLLRHCQKSEGLAFAGMIYALSSIALTFIREGYKVGQAQKAQRGVQLLSLLTLILSTGQGI